MARSNLCLQLGSKRFQDVRLRPLPRGRKCLARSNLLERHAVLAGSWPYSVNPAVLDPRHRADVTRPNDEVEDSESDVLHGTTDHVRHGPMVPGFQPVGAQIGTQAHLGEFQRI